MVADQVIEEAAGNKIKDGDVILTYARFEHPFYKAYKFAKGQADHQSWRKYCLVHTQRDVIFL